MPRSYAEEWRRAQAESREVSAARRDRVLRHPDLVAALGAAPLYLRDPMRWSGWIPPRTAAESSCCDMCGRGSTSCYRGADQHFGVINDSPMRRALVEIAAEALRREREEPAELAAELAAGDVAAAVAEAA